MLVLDMLQAFPSNANNNNEGIKNRWYVGFDPFTWKPHKIHTCNIILEAMGERPYFDFGLENGRLGADLFCAIKPPEIPIKSK